MSENPPSDPVTPGDEPGPIPRSKLVAWWGSIIGVCAIILFGSIFVTRSYLIRRDYERENWRPPHLAKLEEDLNGINRDGKEAKLSELEGKAWVAGYNYTDCPAGCLGMAAVMKSLLDEFESREDFHLVSISVNPEDDTPAKMDAWVKDKGVASPKWWFLTGDEERIRNYMISQFMLLGVEEETDPTAIQAQGPFRHDQRLVLVDKKANIRGYYDVMNPQIASDEIQRLERDLRMVLNPDLKLKDFQTDQPAQ